MKKFLLVAMLLFSNSAQAQTLNDQAQLASDPTFQQRVRTSMLAAAVAISNESGAAALHANRDALAVQILLEPTIWVYRFSYSVATDATVSSAATSAGTVVITPANLAARAALVTDASINNAVSGQWNSFFQH